MLLKTESERIQLLNMLLENIGLEKSLNLVSEDLIKKYALENKILE